jgi:hypothetical protein
VVAAIAIPTLSVVSESPAKRAAELRREALAACDAQRYRECQERLDDARALDPDGEQSPEVKARRHMLEGVPHGR